MKVFVGVFAIAALLFVASSSLFPSKAQTGKPAGMTGLGSHPLGMREFWALIDHSAAFEADPEAQLADLRASLDRLSANQIADFERLFDATMRQSYSWDLWGAAYVANGGASDDGFEYFRCWLISKGRRVFEAVSAHPDDLADLIADGETAGSFEFEDIAYVAREAWSAKTGRDEMPVTAAMLNDEAPKGAPFSEDASALALRYPKLWKRFGS